MTGWVSTHAATSKLILPTMLAVLLASPPATPYEGAPGDYAVAADPALGLSAQFGRWTGPINMVYDPDDAPSIFADTDLVLDLLEEATGEWELVSGIQFNVVGADAGILDDENLGPNSKDGLVRVFWGDANGAAGLAGPEADFYDSDLGYYAFIDGNVELNLNEDIWDYQSDLVDVLTHELGHLIGFGHSDNPDSMMYSNPYNHLLHPRADDILAARAMYGYGSLVIDDVTQPIAQWVYAAPANAPASDTQFLFRSTQNVQDGAYISVANANKITEVTSAAPDNEFVRFNYSVDAASKGAAINNKTTVHVIDPFGYLYGKRDLDLDCPQGFICSGWTSIATTDAIKTIPGEWHVYVVDDDSGLVLQSLAFTVTASVPFNKPPVAEVTVTGVSATVVNVSLDVSDPEGNAIDVIWRTEGGSSSGITDLASDGDTVSRDLSFKLSGQHTFYIELSDDQPRYGSGESDPQGAGGGFQSLISITVDLPLNADEDVTVIASFVDGMSGGGGGSGGNDVVVNSIAGTTALQNVSSTSGASTAGFSAGASADAGSSTATTFSNGTSIVIAGSVSPQASDIGQAAEIFVVLYATSLNPPLSYRNVDGLFVSWGGSLKNGTLLPAYEVGSLAANEKFEVFSGNVQAGVYRIFLGYRLAAGGPIHFNGSGYRVNVN